LSRKLDECKPLGGGRAAEAQVTEEAMDEEEAATGEA
jgi:hypothetical protein